jgi:hypothetical protein
MTADDFVLLFIAFGGFVIAPALLLWGFARIFGRKQDGGLGPDIRPDIDSPGASDGDERKETARSGRANDLLHRLASWRDTARRRVEQLDGTADAKA